MLSRTFDAGLLNALVNHPVIRPEMGGSGDIDLTAAVAMPRNVFLLGEHGAFTLSWSAPHTYEAHAMVLPSGRGRWALSAAADGIAYMAARGAQRIWARAHPNARNVALFLQMIGLKPCGSLPCDLGNGPVDYLIFDRSPL